MKTELAEILEVVMKTQLINIQHKEERLFVQPKQHVFPTVVVNETKKPVYFTCTEKINLEFNWSNECIYSLNHLNNLESYDLEKILDKLIEHDLENIGGDLSNKKGISIDAITTNSQVIYLRHDETDIVDYGIFITILLAVVLTLVSEKANKIVNQIKHQITTYIPSTIEEVMIVLSIIGVLFKETLRGYLSKLISKMRSEKRIITTGLLSS